MLVSIKFMNQHTQSHGKSYTETEAEPLTNVWPMYSRVRRFEEAKVRSKSRRQLKNVNCKKTCLRLPELMKWQRTGGASGQT